MVPFYDEYRTLKLPLTDPERVEKAGSVVEQGVQVVLGKPVSALEEVELDDERAAADLAAELLDEAGDRLHGAAGREHVVVDQNACPGLDRLRVQLEDVLAVLEPVARADRLGRQLPGPSRGDEAAAEL